MKDHRMNKYVEDRGRRLGSVRGSELASGQVIKKTRMTDDERYKQLVINGRLSVGKRLTRLRKSVRRYTQCLGP